MRAFSLVELSIVLVILGLLTGGILAGQSLIRASELRSVTAQLMQYHAAIYTFRDKYMGLPGDMRNATSFWGIAAGATGYDATCEAVFSSSVATCNGNGDGVIRNSSIANTETFRAWQHLANAGLIEGAYTGRNETNDHVNPSYVGGRNVPLCKIGNCRIAVSGEPVAVAADANQFARPAGINSFSVRSLQSAGTFTPEEVWGIDQKLDDGKALSGKFFIIHKMTSGWAPNCVDSDNPAIADYNLTHKQKACGPNYAL